MTAEMESPTARKEKRIPRRSALGFVFTVVVCLLATGLMVTSSGAAPPSAGLTRFTYTQYHMGVDARIVVYARDLATAEDACAAAFARIAALDSIMSDYQLKSELNRLSASAGGPATPVSRDLLLVLRRALEVSRRSDGAFDVTAGPIIALWRAARKSGRLPDPAEIARARKLVGWQKIRLDEKACTARLMVPGMKLDLGGIAKGYAADAAQQVLKLHGITRALVEMGGDIVVSGSPPGAEGWTIRAPNAGDDQGPAELKLADRAISTSGDTEQFTEIGGRRYSHIVDPRTGHALTRTHQPAQVRPGARLGVTSPR